VVAPIGGTLEGFPVLGRKDFLQGEVEFLLVGFGDALDPHVYRPIARGGL
jgi:hypothetical protein